MDRQRIIEEKPDYCLIKLAGAKPKYRKVKIVKEKDIIFFADAFDCTNYKKY